MGIALNGNTVNALALPQGKAIHFYWDDTLKGFGLKIQIGADDKPFKTWVIQYRVAGKQRRLKIADVVKLNAKQARDRATELLAKVTLGIDPAEERQTTRTASAVTLKSVIDQYLEMRERKLEGDKRRVSSLNITKLYLAKGGYFRPLHGKPINAIDKRDIAMRLNDIIKEHSENTANRARAHLSAFYTWAMKEGIADENPVIGTNDPEGNAPRTRVLKNHELVAIWNACEDAGEFGKIVRLLMLTGCRRSEIGQLRWSWLDLEHEHTMTIPSTVAKNHRAHTLPLVGMMRQIIDSVPQMVNRDSLFGVRAEGFTRWASGWSRLDVKLAEPWTLHDLRRTLSTGMHEMGIEPHIVETILNHVSGHKGGVAGVYNYARYGAQMKRALGMWSDHIASIVTRGERKLLAFPASA